MSSFATAVQLDVPSQTSLHRDNDSHRVSTGGNDTIDMPLPPKHAITSGTNVDAKRPGKASSLPYPLVRAHLSERSRPPSAHQADSAAGTIASSTINISVPVLRTQSATSSVASRNHVTQLEVSEPAMEVTKTQKRQCALHFAALCWSLTLGGWNDGSVGPLLPVRQDHYSVSQSIVIS